MELRFNLFDNEIAATFAKRFANTGLVINQSSLPASTRELVSLRASQINGCGWCIDMHTKEAAAAGETADRLNLVAALVCLVALINAANRLAVIVHQKGGSYEADMFEAAIS